MGIKLLSKNEINKALNKDKSLEIAEGLKISRKIDSLRELRTKEEESLEKFRNESISAITKEINELSTKKDLIQKEIAEKKSSLDNDIALLKAEKVNLYNLKDELIDKEKKLNYKEEELKKSKKDNDIVSVNLKDSILRAENREEETKRLHLIAFDRENEARAKLDTATKINENAFKLIEDNRKKIDLENKNILEKERLLAIKEKENAIIREELDNEKIRLADQRATLEKEFRLIKEYKIRNKKI